VDAKGGSITLLAESFVSLIFSARALTPESAGYKPFSGINVVIVSYQLGEETHIKIATEVQEALWSKQIKSSIQVLDEHRLNNSVLFYGAAVLIVDDKLIATEHIDSLVRFSKKRPIIRLNIDETSHINLLAEINFADELTLKSTERTAIRNQVNEYISRNMA
jgi:MarR-like DNA-binding transcriptional regulator SgrR of sgrS sRNA